MVSKTLLATLAKPASFEGRSSLRTYATGILKFKIIDLRRSRAREVHIEALDERSMDDALDALSAQSGHWREPPPAWQRPDQSLEQRQFMEVLQDCVDRLPARTARVFMMRECFAICEACRNVDEQLRFIRRAMRRRGDDDPPSR